MTARPTSVRQVVTVALALAVGGLHFVTGPDYGGPWPGFVNGYLIDLLLPMVVFLLLALPGLPLLARRHRIWLATFCLGAVIETAQGFGLALFGRTFDPWDYLMYALGAGLGWAMDRLIGRLERRRAV